MPVPSGLVWDIRDIWALMFPRDWTAQKLIRDMNFGCSSGALPDTTLGDQSHKRLREGAERGRTDGETALRSERAHDCLPVSSEGGAPAFANGVLLQSRCWESTDIRGVGFMWGGRVRKMRVDCTPAKTWRHSLSPVLTAVLLMEWEEMKGGWLEVRNDTGSELWTWSSCEHFYPAHHCISECWTRESLEAISPKSQFCRAGASRGASSTTGRFF